jgi:hypothetical protein
MRREGRGRGGGVTRWNCQLAKRGGEALGRGGGLGRRATLFGLRYRGKDESNSDAAEARELKKKVALQQLHWPLKFFIYFLFLGDIEDL